MKITTLGRWIGIVACQWGTSVCILLILVLSLWNLADYRRSTDWIPVKGVIQTLVIADPAGREVSPPWSGNGKLLCEYDYEVEGQGYSGNEIGVETFEGSSPRARRYRELSASFSEGKPVTVWVNPGSPTQSALFREVLSEMWFGPALGLFWFTALFLGLRYSRRRRKRSESEHGN